MSNVKRDLAIVHGKKAAKCSSFLRVLSSKGFDIQQTQYEGHATELARNSHESYSTILALGGDGTLHEVINGIDRQNQTIRFIPAGTVNCLGHHFGCMTLHETLQHLDASYSQSIDLIEVKRECDTGGFSTDLFWGFIGLGHEGFLTWLARYVQYVPGNVRYPLAGLAATLVIRPIAISLIVNGAESPAKKLTSLLVNNGTADLFSTIRTWDMQDGALEMQVASRNSATQFLYNFNRFFKTPFGKAYDKGIKEISCRFSRSVYMMADGEVYRNIRSVAIRVVPGALKFLIPPGCALRKK